MCIHIHTYIYIYIYICGESELLGAGPLARVIRGGLVRAAHNLTRERVELLGVEWTSSQVMKANIVKPFQKGLCVNEDVHTRSGAFARPHCLTNTVNTDQKGLVLLAFVISCGSSQFMVIYFTEMCSGSEAGSYSRRIDSCTTQL